MSSLRDTYALIRMPFHRESSQGRRFSLERVTILENVQCLISSLASTNPRRYHNTNGFAGSLSFPRDISGRTATRSARAGWKLFVVVSGLIRSSAHPVPWTYSLWFYIREGQKERGRMPRVWGVWTTPF